uniref:NEDD8-activating enzyme E1 catalytic subunit n=1 Tax=Trypanosoma vivax (strain Y486) TaxID=1055687 RepID=G0U237_TRYVY|nr:putative ubiquitin-activating enzyme e1 [Trypanosoma vivax Y486]
MMVGSLSRSCLRTSFTGGGGVGLQRLVRRQPAFNVSGYNPSNNTWDEVRVLGVGAGGAGCEVLPTLALSGFNDFTVVDMDTVNFPTLVDSFFLPRLILGEARPRLLLTSLSAAVLVSECTPFSGPLKSRVMGFSPNFTPLYLPWIRLLHAAGLTKNLRSWPNGKLWMWMARQQMKAGMIISHLMLLGVVAAGHRGFVALRIVNAVPLIDTGTEGYEGCCRVVLMRAAAPTPCIECLLSLYPHRPTVPLCTLENVPRFPEHCVLYVQQKLWGDMRPGEKLDTDNAEHIAWISAMAQRRKEAFGISGADIDERFTRGVVKNVVPAVVFTNALVASQAVLELIKLLTAVAPALQCFSYYNGAAECGGLASYVTDLVPDPKCPVCAPRPLLSLRSNMSARDVLVAIQLQVGFPKFVSNVDHLDVTLRVCVGSGTVYLLYKSDNPLKSGVVGHTVEEMFAGAGYTSAFDKWCESDEIVFRVECGGHNIDIFAEALMSRADPLG